MNLLPQVCGILLLCGAFFSGTLGEEPTYSVDFASPEFQAAVRKCPFAKVEGDTLIFDIPKEKGMATAMISLPLDFLADTFQGYYLSGEADICFSDIPQPRRTYFGVKFQCHLDGEKNNAWPSFLRLPEGQMPWGSMEWRHCQGKIEWSSEVTGVQLELGIQATNGRFLMKNLRFTRGRALPISVLKLKDIPQAQYTDAFRRLPRMRGVMSPGTWQEPREQDFADLEKWGANLIRWQMGLDGITSAADMRKRLEDRFAQIEKVLEMAKRHHLYVVIDVHTMQSSRGIVLGTPEGRDVLVWFWVEMAKRFGKHPNVFGFNLMNEPVSAAIEPDGPSLNEQYFRLIQAIREVDPETPIILDTDQAGVPETLEYMQVFPFKNIIYSPHFYKPFALTHQLDPHQKEYNAYPNPEQGWDKEFLRKEMAIAREFQQKTGARIYIGEFSCIRWAPGAEKFIGDCMDLFEEYGWDWSYHAFREWQGWSVECDGEPSRPEWKETTRKKVLLDGFRR